MNLRKNIIISSFWSGQGTIFVFILNFIYGIILARLVSPEVFGLFVSMVALVEISSLVNSISTSVTFIQNKEFPDDEFAGTAFFINIGIILIFLVIVLFTGFIIFKKNFYMFFLLCIGKTCEMIFGTHITVAEKNFQFKITNLSFMLSNILAGMLAILLAMKNKGLFSLTFQYLVTKAINGLIVFVLANKKIKYCFKINYFKRFISNGKFLFFVTGLEKVKQELDRLIMHFFLPSVDIGYYYRAISLAERFPSLVYSSIRNVCMVAFSKLQDQKEKSSTLFNTIIFLFVRISVLIGLIFLLFSEETIDILYGVEWIKSAPLLKILVIYGCFAPILILFRTVFYSFGLYGKVSKIALFQFFIYIIFMFTGVYLWGVFGASWALAIFMLISFFIYLLTMKKIVNVEIKNNYINPLIVSVCTYFIVLYIKNNFYSYKDYRFLILCLLQVLIYISGLFILDKKEIFNLIKFFKERYER
ncbi:MAG: oligosaccharide flippase family protein [Endomicrobia bacterium]|nr:oligosaccharide flippase family protein [Endomicrobiia bacterium]